MFWGSTVFNFSPGRVGFVGFGARQQARRQAIGADDGRSAGHRIEPLREAWRVVEHPLQALRPGRRTSCCIPSAVHERAGQNMLNLIGPDAIDGPRKFGGGPRHVDGVEKRELAGVNAIRKRAASLE
jgi:hypothetical protein